MFAPELKGAEAMRDASSIHKPGSLGWPWAVKRMMEAANPPPPKGEKRRWTLIGLK
jgi:hypothetical protein